MYRELLGMAYILNLLGEDAKEYEKAADNLKVAVNEHLWDERNGFMEEFFGKMEERTGTLWEFRELIGSHDHGFVSYVFVVIQEALKRLEG